MRNLIKLMVLSIVALFVMFITTQCGNCEHGAKDSATENATATSTEDAVENAEVIEKVILCGNCGEIKGTENCCKAGAEICSVCGLHLHSAGCCKMEKGEDVEMSAKCIGADVTKKCCAKEKGAKECSSKTHSTKKACCKSKE